MNIEDLFKDKTIKAKAKVKTLGEWLLSDEMPIEELLAFAEQQKSTHKATCIEAIEWATKKTPSIANEAVFEYVTELLKEEEPRLKWESAKVIGNTAKLYPEKLEKAIDNLLLNAENEGTVVRWATAYSLAEIIKLKTENNWKLVPKVAVLCEKEADNGVNKKYADALKKVKK
ncbi:HEAT repeat domain-containing protein [Paenimyroides aestuarii]|uniref:HEAT repeat domain-containing protein n=1 Tax=Paenimyroides aestuarii TaxID=2968490 RepID=A0ABY5NQH3_9FLAO|nr:hypothetical protein [Paenimyroides aestuarii]UUV20682.1 hypothetical protein NPX36_10070 [Paenimyroides aestuarii]